MTGERAYEFLDMRCHVGFQVLLVVEDSSALGGVDFPISLDEIPV